MSRIPPEVDHLMWALAEKPSPQALDEFASRYPEFKTELVKRVKMVRGLRNEMSGARLSKEGIPKFNPRPVAHPGPSKGSLVALTMAGVAILVACITAFSSIHRAASPPKTVAIGDSRIDAPLKIPGPVLTQPSPPPQVVPSPPVVVPPREEVASEVEKPRDLVLKDVQILDALKLITAGTHLTLEIGPGFVNQKVSLTFRNRTTTEMLFQMAKDFAFTVTADGRDRFIVLPVPDPESSTSDPNNPQRRVIP